MIRKCNESDREKVLAYLYEDPCKNLFFIGDINNAGFDSEYCDIWANEENNKIDAIYLRWYNNLCLASYTSNLDQKFVDELIEKYDIINISGVETTVNTINLDGWYNDDCYFCKFTTPNLTLTTDEVERATIKDADEIFEIEKSIFTNITDNNVARNMESDGKYFVVRKDNQIVSMAATTAECEGLAMIVGVCTKAKYRNNGYASKVVTKLCTELLKEGKTSCLFYNNPDAGKIYHSLGFEDIGRWALRRKIHD